MSIQIDDPVTVEGIVAQFDLTGRGPNSGEFTLGINTTDGRFVQVFGGIMDADRKSSDGLEHGVFAAYAAVAALSFAQKVKVRCTYQKQDKERVTELALLP